MVFDEPTQSENNPDTTFTTPNNGVANGVMWSEASLSTTAVSDTQPTSPDVQSVTQPTTLVVREIVETLLLTFFIFWLVNSLIGRYRIDGSSMTPTLVDGQYLIINNFSYYLDEPERGDIIVFQHPNNDLNLIKRVVGVPGDVVLIEESQVSVNGIVIDEPYIKAPPNYSGTWEVPHDKYFVLGDNRNSSSDSHSWGFLPAQNILGKAQIVYWPMQDWDSVPHYFHAAVEAADG